MLPAQCSANTLIVTGEAVLAFVAGATLEILDRRDVVANFCCGSSEPSERRITGRLLDECLDPRPVRKADASGDAGREHSL